MDSPISWHAVPELYRLAVEASLESDEVPLAWFEPNLDQQLLFAQGFVALTSRRIVSLKSTSSTAQPKSPATASNLES